MYQGKKLGIIGCGEQLADAYKRCIDYGISVDYFFDNRKCGEVFGNQIRPVTDIVTLREQNELFLIVSTEIFYDEIKRQIESYGFIEYKEFIRAACVGKKSVFIYGNCYAPAVSKLLSTNKEFSNNYYIIGDSPIYKMSADEVLKYKERIEYADVYIHQDIWDGNRLGKAFSVEHQKTKEKCIDITFPNMVGVGKAFFPTLELRNPRNKNSTEGLPGPFPYEDLLIDNYVNEGADIYEIASRLKNDGNFKRKKVICNYRNVIRKFKKREKNWDIKCIDYILEISKYRRTFYDLVHPTNEIMYLIVSNILMMLDIDEPLHYMEKRLFPVTVYPMSTEVAKYLKFNWMESPKFRDKSILEYVKKYLEWCYEK